MSSRRRSTIRNGEQSLDSYRAKKRVTVEVDGMIIGTSNQANIGRGNTLFENPEMQKHIPYQKALKSRATALIEKMGGIVPLLSVYDVDNRLSDFRTQNTFTED